MPRTLLSILLLCLALGGCASLGYYGQAIGGHLDLMTRARPIMDDIRIDPAVAAALKARLARALAMREFASRELGLPDNDSYRRYADLERPHAVWNLFAAPALSLEAKQWCYPFAGCVPYRGYFSSERAEREAEKLRAAGYDVHIGGVNAYSTLGWFDDPLLNTMLHYPDAELAGILFHELAHQLLYAPGDAAFNESFAATVEREGVRRWLEAAGRQDEYAAYIVRAQRREAFATLVLAYRNRLRERFAADTGEHVKRADKTKLFSELRRDYVQMKNGWGGYAAYDGWIENLNNAKLLSVGLYHDHVPAFQNLLARHAGNLPAFYDAAKKLAHEPKDMRDRALAMLR